MGLTDMNGNALGGVEPAKHITTLIPDLVQVLHAGGVVVLDCRWEKTPDVAAQLIMSPELARQLAAHMQAEGIEVAKKLPDGLGGTGGAGL